MITNNPNLERAILSTIVFDSKVFEEIYTLLGIEDFYIPAHKNIFNAMINLDKNDKPIDEEFLKNELIAMGKYDENVYLHILSTNPISNYVSYIKEIKELSTRRELSTIALESKQFSEDPNKDTNDAINDLQARLYLLTQNSSMDDFKDAKRVSEDTLEYIRKMKERGNKNLIGLDTGFSELNLMTTGFGNGDLIILAARPSMGKTALALNMALRSIDLNVGVVFFSLEMPAEQLMLRLLSAKTSIPLQNIRKGDMNDDEWSRLNTALNEFEKRKFYVDDNSGININQIKGKLRKLKTKNPEIGFVVIDYLQLIQGSANMDRHLQVSEISRNLKIIARELEIPIMALSQLNRGVDGRNDKRPMLSDLRESGAIEQDADIIMFVYRDDVYKAKDEKDKEEKAKKEGTQYKSDFRNKEIEDAEIIIGKQRNGPIGTVHLVFNKQYTRFDNKTNHYVVSFDATHETKLENVPI